MDTYLPFAKRVQPIGFYPLPEGPAQPADVESALVEIPDEAKATEHLIYLHIPFCYQRCSFCLFYIYPFKASTWSDYFSLLKKNLGLLSDSPFVQNLRFGSVFVGGGSPNVLRRDDLVELMELLSTRFHLSQNLEITMEWHPLDNDKSKLELAKELGVNRLSFGVQTFDPVLAQTLRLPHTVKQASEIIDTALEVGFDKVNIDLLSCIPGESPEQLLRDLQVADSFRSGALTVNPLEFIPNTPLYTWVKTREALPDPGETAKLDSIKLTNDFMAEHGYVQQRFYNFHLPGKRHEYNHLSARPGCSILPAGLGAYGMINGYAALNHSNPQRYREALEQNALPFVAGSPVTLEERKRSYIVTALLEMRISPSEYEAAFGSALEDDFGHILQRQVSCGLLKRDGDQFAMTELGALWGDNVCFEYYSQRQTDLMNVRFDVPEHDVRPHHYAPTTTKLYG